MTLDSLARLQRRPSGTAGLAAILFAWLAATAWVRPLALPDEGRYVGVALEMLWSGDWLVPRLDTLPYFHKPPLFYWLTGASLAAFGINEWAARIASLLAATAAGMALYLFVRRWIDGGRALLVLLVFATTPFLYGGAQFANLDTLVMACIACTILSAADTILSFDGNAGRPRRLTLYSAYAFAALGVLAKGLIGVVIPVLVIGAWLLFSRRARIVAHLISPVGLALFAFIAVPWFALMEMRHPGFLQYFFVHHHLERYTTSEFNGHQPFWFFLPVFAVATLPWCAFLLPAARYRAAPSHAPLSVDALMWLWLVLALVFFSIPQSKLVGYALVAVPPFAILAAGGIARLAQARGGTVRWAAASAAAAVMICAAALATAVVRDRHEVGSLAAELKPLLGSADSTLVMLRTYPFSLPFYLQRRPPIPVVLNWSDERLVRRDNWRQELHEAATFAPDLAYSTLLKPAQLDHLVACSGRTVLIVAPRTMGERHSDITRNLQRVSANAHYTLWRSRPSPVAARRPECGP